MPAQNRAAPANHVRLVLLRRRNTSFYLDIPIDIIGTLCLTPRKYLLFLGWCILGSEGGLSLRQNGAGIDVNGMLVDGATYYYVADTADLSRAIDLDVFKVRTNIYSATVNTRENFRTELLQRDVRCVWSDLEYGAGMHIIPFSRGSEWLQLIIGSRDGETVGNLNDIRNGIFANSVIHDAYDSHDIAILKTPNPILDTVDVQPRPNRDLPDDVTYPSDHSRYSLQWLRPRGRLGIPNNTDAAFKKRSRKPKPSDLLLHYRYGATAVKCWGHGESILQTNANPPRPTTSGLAPPGRSRARRRTRTHTTGRRGGAQTSHQTRARNGTGARDEEELETWDAYDLVLYFWSNTPAAKEIRRKKLQEDTQRMEQWREGVAQALV